MKRLRLSADMLGDARSWSLCGIIQIYHVSFKYIKESTSSKRRASEGRGPFWRHQGFSILPRYWLNSNIEKNQYLLESYLADLFCVVKLEFVSFFSVSKLRCTGWWRWEPERPLQLLPCRKGPLSGGGVRMGQYYTELYYSGLYLTKRNFLFRLALRDSWRNICAATRPNVLVAGKRWQGNY